MKPGTIEVRPLTLRDLAFADAVRAAAGWNQTLEDWRRFLALEPEGCFLAAWDGAASGTATTIVHGPELAWIGMVLVHPEFRRRGIGNALLRHCLDHLHQRGIRCLKLDATPLGEPVYEGLGFCREWTLSRWERASEPAGAANPTPGHDATASSPSRRTGLTASGMPPLGTLEALDAAAFGIARGRLLQALVEQGVTTRFATGPDGGVAGFGMSRAGARARYLGPVIAASPVVGLALVADLLADHLGAPTFWDIPEPNTAAVNWAAAHGFTRQRPLTRMFLGENRHPGNAGMQFALAGPEVG